MKRRLSLVFAMLILGNNLALVNAQTTDEAETQIISEQIATSWECRINEKETVYDDDGTYLGKSITIEFRTDPDEDFKPLNYDDTIAEGILMSNYELLEEKLIMINGETLEQNSGWNNLIQKCQKNILPVDKYPEDSDNEFNWLPSTEEEFAEFQEKYGSVALINGYIVMSVDPEENHGLLFNESHEGTASYSVVKYHNACNMDNVEPGSSLNPIKVYKINSPGILMLSWKKQEYKGDNLETVWESRNYYSASEDLTVKEISEDEYKKNYSMGKGDINGDDIIDLTDLSNLSLYLLGDKSLTDTQKKAADVNGDGEVRITDLARLMQYISRVITSL
ncbi:MAG: dockerin type I repeat-containing protein [Oscillospiraceae bacterium]|nr:dockerin type I repeat-containing protein [Oscillospiraceae bacterium]